MSHSKISGSAVFQCSNSAWVATRNERPSLNTRMKPQCPQTVGVPGSGSGVVPSRAYAAPAVRHSAGSARQCRYSSLHCKREERGRAGPDTGSIRPRLTAPWPSASAARPTRPSPPAGSDRGPGTQRSAKAGPATSQRARQHFAALFQARHLILRHAQLFWWLPCIWTTAINRASA